MLLEFSDRNLSAMMSPQSARLQGAPEGSARCAPSLTPREHDRGDDRQGWYDRGRIYARGSKPTGFLNLTSYTSEEILKIARSFERWVQIFPPPLPPPGRAPSCCRSAIRHKTAQSPQSAQQPAGHPVIQPRWISAGEMGVGNTNVLYWTNWNTGSLANPGEIRFFIFVLLAET